MKRRWFLKLSAGIICLVLFSLFYLDISLLKEGQPLILKLRLVRLLLTLIAGYTLAVNGAVLQSVLRNPLADPYLIGVTGGALIGFTLGELVGINYSLFLSIPAFIFSLLSVIFVYYLARRGGKVRKELLILSGLFVNFFSYALVFLLLVTKREVLEKIIYTLWGYTGIILKEQEFLPFLVVMGFLFILPSAFIFFSKELDAVTLGESEALSLGVDVERLKKIVFLLTSFSTAIIVSLAGAIGFIGLMIPNIVRRTIGGKHCVLIPASGIGGALIAILADYVSKNIALYELPLGIITSILGVPFFIWLILGGGYEGGKG